MSWDPGAGPPWRFLRSDRTVVENHIERKTLRRVLSFARPHRRLILAFLAVTVVDAGLVVRRRCCSSGSSTTASAPATPRW